MEPLREGASSITSVMTSVCSGTTRDGAANVGASCAPLTASLTKEGGGGGWKDCRTFYRLVWLTKVCGEDIDGLPVRTGEANKGVFWYVATRLPLTKTGPPTTVGVFLITLGLNGFSIILLPPTVITRGCILTTGLGCRSMGPRKEVPLTERVGIALVITC